MISKAQWFAHSIVWLAVASGLFIGGRAGLVVAGLCFTVGVGLLGTSFGHIIKRNHTQPSKVVAPQATEVVVGIKGIHAYSQNGENLRELEDSNQPNSELDLFLHVWLVSETETDLGIKDCQLKIKAADGSVRSAERIHGDLHNWHIDMDKEETDLWDTHIERVRESLHELDTGQALRCGAPREGWLHFVVRNITPGDYKTGPMEFSVEDSLAVASVGMVNCSRYLSGKVERNELGDPPHISPTAVPSSRTE